MTAHRRFACSLLVAAAFVGACNTPYRHLRRAPPLDASVDSSSGAAPDASSPGSGGGAVQGGAGGAKGASGGAGSGGDARSSGGTSGNPGAGGASADTDASAGGSNPGCTTPGVFGVTDWDRSCWQ